MLSFRMRAIFVFCCLLCLGALPVRAQDALQYQSEQFFDANQSLSAQAVAQQRFAPASDQIAVRKQTGTLWLKFTVTGPTQGPIYLKLTSLSLGDVRVYLPEGSAQTSGSRWEGQALSAHELSVGKLLPALSTPGPHALYVAITSRGFHSLFVELLSEREFAAVRRLADVILAAQTTFALMLLCILPVAWRQTGDVAYLALVPLLAFYALRAALHHGGVVGDWGLSAQGLADLQTALLCVGIMTFPAYLALLFPVRQAFGRAVWVRKLLYLLAIVSLIAVAVFHRRGFLPLLMAACMALAMHGTVLHFGGTKRALLALRSVPVSSMGMLMASVSTFLALATTGIVPARISSLHGLEGDVLVWPVVALGVLVILARRNKQAQIAVQVDQARSKERLAQEAQRRTVQQHFMSMLVHEIRTPLSVIQLGNRALTQRALTQEKKDAWEHRMNDAVSDIGQILANCNQADRVEAGALSAAIGPLVVKPLVDRAVQAVQGLHTGADARVQVVYAPDGVGQAHCLGDPGYVDTLLTNLLGNALKYSPPGSAVDLRVRALDQAQTPGLEFSVRSTLGPAGAPDPARVFDRYYRAQAATSVSGTGLGLWLCQSLAGQMQSRIAMEVDEQNVIFSFVLERTNGGVNTYINGTHSH